MKKIVIDGIIGLDVDGEDIRRQLAEASGEDITVEIASPGGFISDGLVIYNELNRYDGNVDTHLVGMVASMATYISMVGNRRTAENNAVFMIHNGSGVAIGDHRDMFKFGNHLDSLTNMIAKEYASKTGAELPDIREAMDNETFYYGDEIKQAGFVHEIIGDPAPEDRSEAVAFAELMVEDCQGKINSPEMIRKDMAALSTMLHVVPEMKVTGFDDRAELRDESWSKSESEARWRRHVGVESNDDLPNAKYDKRFVHITDSGSLTARNFPVFDFKNNQEFVNISAVRNGLSRLPQSGIPAADKPRVERVLQKYLDKFNEEQEETNMDIVELRAQHPDLYEEVVNLGAESERNRVVMLTEMRKKFPKPHSQNVIDTAITEGHTSDELILNLMAADQAAAEVQGDAQAAVTPPPNGDGVPPVADGEMTHSDHVDAMSEKIAKLPGVIA